MSIGAHLIHKCTVQRATFLNDRYNDQKKTWSDWLTDVACRLVVKAQRIIDSETAQFVTVTGYKLLVMPGQDIHEGDRVVNVRFEDGAEDAGPYTIKSVLGRRARGLRHVSLELERVK